MALWYFLVRSSCKSTNISKRNFCNSTLRVSGKSMNQTHLLFIGANRCTSFYVVKQAGRSSLKPRIWKCYKCQRRTIILVGYLQLRVPNACRYLSNSKWTEYLACFMIFCKNYVHFPFLLYNMRALVFQTLRCRPWHDLLRIFLKIPLFFFSQAAIDYETNFKSSFFKNVFSLFLIAQIVMQNILYGDH